MHVLDLATGAERAGGVPRQALHSDRWPSMWRGRIAFARHDPEHANVDQVELWSPRARALRALPHGTVPTECPFRGKNACSGADRAGTVYGLDLGSKLLAFAWRVQAPSAIGGRGYEIRADRLSDGRSALVGSGAAGEACAGNGGGFPSSPVVLGRAVVYSILSGDCYSFTSTLARFSAFPVAGAAGRLPGTVLSLAADGTALYALVAPPNDANEDAGCVAHGPCAIQAVPAPPLSAVARRPRAPFF